MSGNAGLTPIAGGLVEHLPRPHPKVKAAVVAVPGFQIVRGLTVQQGGERKAGPWRGNPGFLLRIVQQHTKKEARERTGGGGWEREAA